MALPGGAWTEARTGLSSEAALRLVSLWLFSPATYNERPEFVEQLLQNALANPFRQSLTGFLRQQDAIGLHDTLDRLGGIRCPTLVSVAEDDLLVPPRFSRELAARIPRADLRVVAGAGHVYFWERPDAFNELCLDFLAGQPPPA